MVDRICSHCGKHFSARPADIKNGRGKNCSVTCRALASRLPREKRNGAVQCSDGSWALLSPEDADLSELAWGLHPRGYPMMSRLKGPSVRMHRVVLERVLGRALRKGEIVDHKDGDPRNNKRENLRLATYALNNANSQHKSKTYPFKGGIYRCSRFRFASRITINDKRYNLGTFDTPEAAANMYDQFASQVWEDFAVINFNYVEVPRQD